MTLPPDLGVDEGIFIAAIDLLGRTAAHSFVIRHCVCDENEGPTVWIAQAHWPDIPGVMPEHDDAAAGLSPWRAVYRLLEASLDGGHCRHCDRPTAVDDKPADELLRGTEELICWYRYDPELHTFRRSCEGQAA